MVRTFGQLERSVIEEVWLTGTFGKMERSVKEVGVVMKYVSEDDNIAMIRHDSY